MYLQEIRGKVPAIRCFMPDEGFHLAAERTFMVEIKYDARTEALACLQTVSAAG
jgi:hypothetical protein